MCVSGRDRNIAAGAGPGLAAYRQNWWPQGSECGLVNMLKLSTSTLCMDCRSWDEQRRWRYNGVVRCTIACCTERDSWGREGVCLAVGCLPNGALEFIHEPLQSTNLFCCKGHGDVRSLSLKTNTSGSTSKLEGRQRVVLLSTPARLQLAGVRTTVGEG